MFAFWGRFVFRHRRLVVGVMTLMLLIGGVFGLGLPAQLSQSGYDDPNSESTQAAVLADETFGRDHKSDIILVVTAPAGLTVDDPAFAEKVTERFDQAKADYPDTIGAINSYWSVRSPLLADQSKQHAFASVELTGTTDTESLNQFKSLEGAFDIPGVNVEISGLQAIGDALGVGMEKDTLRAEVIALPLVAILLFFVFGGIVAASLPVIIGVLTIAGATGAMWVLTHFMEVNTFAQPVVTLIGLGVAIDYGLFIVSRFREEIAEGYEVDVAVRRTVMTAGRTVVFSATMLVVSFAGLLMFPQGFLKSVALGGLAAIALAALCSITVLPAILGMLGTRVDALGLPFLRKTKTKEEIERGFWGKMTDWVMKHPAWVATPIIVILLLLIVPFKNIAFGGLSETYLPPGNETRVAQEHFDELFPSFRTNPVNLVITGADSQEVFNIALEANQVEGFTGPFQPRPAVDGVNMLTSGLIDPDRPGNTIDELRAIPAPDGVEILVGGVPAMTQDSITALADGLPMMIIFIVVVTTLLMFLAFGSLVLPIKAALMSALGLGSTLGILTWIFIDGHGSSFLNFTPGPLMAAVLVLLLAIIFGLSTDYEVFLLSRMIEARENGAITKEASRLLPSRGWDFLVDQMGDHLLWVGLLTLALAAVPFVARLEGSRMRLAAVTMGAGALSLVYIAAIGGDFMGSRLLLIPILGLAAPVAAVPIPLGRARAFRPATAALLPVVVWILVSGFWLREGDDNYDMMSQKNTVLAQDVPIRPDPADGEPGVFYGPTALTEAEPAAGLGTSVYSGLAIGLPSFRADADTSVIDLLGLGEPVVSHFKLGERGELAGHEKTMPVWWFLARATAPGSEARVEPGLETMEPFYTGDFGPEPSGTLAERTALTRAAMECEPVADLIDAAEAPLDARRFVKNLLGAPARTLRRIPANPEELLDLSGDQPRCRGAG